MLQSLHPALNAKKAKQTTATKEQREGTNDKLEGSRNQELRPELPCKPNPNANNTVHPTWEPSYPPPLPFASTHTILCACAPSNTYHNTKCTLPPKPFQYQSKVGNGRYTSTDSSTPLSLIETKSYLSEAAPFHLKYANTRSHASQPSSKVPNEALQKVKTKKKSSGQIAQ